MNVTFVSSTPSTIHTSFLISQIVENEERYGRPLETVLFENTDPRIQTVAGVENAKGAEFLVAKGQTLLLEAICAYINIRLKTLYCKYTFFYTQWHPKKQRSKR